jgi:hypothetical protein
VPGLTTSDVPPSHDVQFALFSHVVQFVHRTATATCAKTFSRVVTIPRLNGKLLGPSVLTAVLCFGLVACGSGSTSSTRATTSVTGPETAGSDGCIASQIQITSATVKVLAPEQLSATINVLNMSPGTCSLSGPPSIRLFGSHGTPLPAHVTATTGGPSLPVTLPPKAGGSFTISYRTKSKDPSCPSATKAVLSFSGAQGSVTASARFAPCNGDMTVSPVAPAT